MNTLAVLTMLKSVLELALPLLPDDELKSHLSDTARKVDDKLADLAETAKFLG